MIAVLQRVSSASILARSAHGRTHEDAIQRGLVALVAAERGDTESEAEWIADRIARLRLFPDDDGRMNRSLLEVGGEALVVSQFTLAGDARKGTRPSFTNAEAPERAAPLVDLVARSLASAHGVRVATGVFGADMQIRLVNDGPVTLILERRPRA